MRHTSSIFKATFTFILGLTLSVKSYATLIDPQAIVDNWSQLGSPFVSSNSANWTVEGNEFTTGGNNTGLILSDFDTTGDFTFSTTFRARGDNDLMGIVMGVQGTDINNFSGYSLGWGGGGVTNLNGIQLRKLEGTSPSTTAGTTLWSDNTLWASNVTYNVIFSRIANDLIIDISGGGLDIDATITDSTFTSGKIGFQSWSQYANFGANIQVTGNTQGGNSLPVSEPQTIALFGLTLLGLSLTRRKV